MPRKTNTAPENRLPTAPSSECQPAPEEAVGTFLRHMDGPVRVRVRRFDGLGKVIYSEVLKVPAGSLAELMRRAAKHFA